MYPVCAGVRVHCVAPELRPERALFTTVNERSQAIQFNRVAAAIAKGKHPVPSRTRKLSLSAPMVLRGRPRGRAGHRRNTIQRGLTHPGRPSLLFRSATGPMITEILIS